MKRSLLLTLCLIISISLGGLKIDLRPEIKTRINRSQERLANYTYSLADTLTYEFLETYKAEYSYQEEVLESVLVKQLINGAWFEIENYTYNYQEDRILQETYQIYNDGWVNYQQENYSYNEEDLIISYQQDNWINDEWEAYLHISYSYDNQGFLVNEEWTYYTTSKELDTAYNVTYLYDTQGRVTSEIWTSSTDDITWINYLKGTYQRNTNGAIIEEDWQYWSTSWISYLQYNHTYNINDKIEYTEGLSLIDNQWQYYDNYQYYYNDNLNTIQIIGKLWDNETQVWNNSYKYDYQYQAVVSNDYNDVIANNLLVTTYPNPFTNDLKFTSDKKLSKVSIYNIKGQKISSQELNKKNGQLSLKALENHPSGIYFFKFEDKQGSKTISKQVKINN
ncbi:T9SS type A sorting domain-containing protein [bacterium]|nr:T9SS type A sorting domain-containing protein [bacterium]